MRIAKLSLGVPVADGTMPADQEVPLPPLRQERDNRRDAAGIAVACDNGRRDGGEVLGSKAAGGALPEKTSSASPKVLPPLSMVTSVDCWKGDPSASDVISNQTVRAANNSGAAGSAWATERSAHADDGCSPVTGSGWMSGGSPASSDAGAGEFGASCSLRICPPPPTRSACRRIPVMSGSGTNICAGRTRESFCGIALAVGNAGAANAPARTATPKTIPRSPINLIVASRIVEDPPDQISEPADEGQEHDRGDDGPRRPEETPDQQNPQQSGRCVQHRALPLG